jgi:hypothetical protein
MANINLDTETMKLVVSKAILDQFNPEVCTGLVEQAVLNLLEKKPEQHGYGRQDGRTMIMRIFDEAVESAARSIVRELIAGEYTERIKDVVRTACEKAFNDPTRMEKVADAMGEALERTLSGRDR